VSEYQYLPSLSLDEYEALRESIRKYGVIQPVIVDESGAIIDGYHRAKACKELDVDYPTRVIEGLTEEEKENLSVSSNIKRRHLSKEQKKELALALRSEGWTQERIAGVMEVSQKTISNWLAVSNFSTPDQSSPKPDKPDVSAELRKQVEYYEKRALEQEKEQIAIIDEKVKVRLDAMRVDYERRLGEVKAKFEEKLQAAKSDKDHTEIDKLVEERTAEKIAALEKARREAEAERVSFDKEHQKRVEQLQSRYESKEKTLQSQIDAKMNEINEAAKAGLDIKKLKDEHLMLSVRLDSLQTKIEEEKEHLDIRTHIKKAHGAVLASATMMGLVDNKISKSPDCCGLSIEEMERYVDDMKSVAIYTAKTIEIFNEQIAKMKNGGGLRIVENN
jgi:ParB family chromosome partitioning protein